MAVRMRPVGWKYDSVRHSLAARGVSTGRRYNAAYADMVEPFSTRAADLIGKTKIAQKGNWVSKILVGKPGVNQWSGSANPDIYKYPFASAAGQVERVGRVPEVAFYGVTNAPFGLASWDPYTGKGTTFVHEIRHVVNPAKYAASDVPLTKKLSLPPSWHTGMNKAEAWQEGLQAKWAEKAGGGLKGKLVGATTEVLVPITPLRTGAGIFESAASDPLGTAAVGATFVGQGAKQIGAGVWRSGKDILVKKGASWVKATPALAKETLKARGFGPIVRSGPVSAVAQKTFGVASKSSGYLRAAEVGGKLDAAIASKPALLRVPLRAVSGTVAFPFRAGAVVDPAFMTVRGTFPNSEISGYIPQSVFERQSAMNVTLPEVSPAATAQQWQQVRSFS